MEKKDSKIFLQPFTEKDIENELYLSWFYDPDVTKYNSHGLFPYTQKQKQDFLESLNKNVVFKILYDYQDADNHIHRLWIGNTSLQSINWIYRSAEFAIVIGDKFVHGQGIGTEVCKRMIEHGFNKLNLNRIWTGTASTNIGMRKVAEKAGMKEEGKFRQGMYLKGEFVNIICYSILRMDYDRLKVDEGTLQEKDVQPELGFDTNIGE